MARIYQWRLVDVGFITQQLGKNTDCGEWEPLGFHEDERGHLFVMYRRSVETEG